MYRFLMNYTPPTLAQNGGKKKKLLAPNGEYYKIFVGSIKGPV